MRVHHQEVNSVGPNVQDPKSHTLTLLGLTKVAK